MTTLAQSPQSPQPAQTMQSMQPTVDEIRQELDRLLEDPGFRRAPSHSRLLRYLVERKTAGDDGALCEAGIAMAVFQRDPAAYDSEIDPIVRVSIGRLRDRLRKHYERFERAPSMIITLPRGRYSPEFRHVTETSASAPMELRGLAVVRTTNLTGNEALDATAGGLSDRLTESLVMMQLPRVITTSAMSAAIAAEGTLIEAGRRLGVSEILETTLSSEPGQRVRIAARLVKVADAELAWAEVRTVAIDSLHAGVDALADAVLSRLAGNSVARPAWVQLPPLARSKIESARLLLTHLAPASIEQARALLDEVTTEFPGSAEGWALRARSCVRRLNYADVQARPLLAELKTSVAAALAIEADHLDARALEALLSHWVGELSQAEIRFRDVLSRAPNHSSARSGYAWLLVTQGRFDEGLAQFDMAATFDPLSLNIVFNRAYVLSLARRHDDARLVFETGVRDGGDSPFALMAFANNELRAGNLDRAEALYRQCLELYPSSQNSRFGLAEVAILRGDAVAARVMADEARSSSPAGWHCAQASLEVLRGDRSAELSQLRHAFDTMESARLLVGVDPAYESIAGDPEFIALLRRLGLDRWCGVGSGHAA